MATEGYDLVGIDCVVMARTTDSELSFVQQMGRGLRRDPANPNKVWNPTQNKYTNRSFACTNVLLFEIFIYLVFLLV